MDKGMEMQKRETQSWIPNLPHLQCSVLLFAGYSLWTSFSLAEDLTPLSSDGKASAYNAGDPGSIPRSGRSPGEGKGYPLLYPCLKNSMDQDTVHGVQSMGSQRVGHDWVTSLWKVWKTVLFSRFLSMDLWPQNAVSSKRVKKLKLTS